MAVINAVNAALASLQKQLDIVASMLLGNLFLAIRPRLVLKEDADTASTDGRLWVEMPHKFCGVGLEDGEPGIFLGLMAHEIGHWLQPIKAIKEVEKETSLLHDAVNIVLDVNCERVVTDILPLFENPLVAVRMLVRNTVKRSTKRKIFYQPQSRRCCTAATVKTPMSLFPQAPPARSGRSAASFLRGNGPTMWATLLSY
jgi:hypothetical protein